MVSVLEAALEQFLEHRPRNWEGEKAVTEIKPHHLLLGATGGTEFEVVVATAPGRPTKTAVVDVWKARHGGRSIGTVLLVCYERDGATHGAIAGPDADAPVRHQRLDLATKTVLRALDARSLAEAREIIAELPVDAIDEDHPGIENQGLFAWHSLTTDVPTRTDWDEAVVKGKAVRGTRDDSLLAALGWTVQTHGDVKILQDGVHPRAIAVLVSTDETFDRPSLKYGLGLSPVEHAIAQARAAKVDWVVAVRGNVVRLYAANSNEGISRAGLATYAQINTELLRDENAGYAWLLLSPGALDSDGSVRQILEESRIHATALGERLRDRVYKDVIPSLAELVANRLGDRSEKGLQQAYHVSLVVLFRLLFVSYAEDRGLLPYARSATGPANAYSHRALKTLAVHLAEGHASGQEPSFDESATTLWDDLLNIWEAVHDGNADWQVPAYGGNLFRADTDTGAQIASLDLTNAEFGPLLAALLVDVGEDGTRGPVDFRSLSVREFGTIYEGLLESSLSVAPSDLAIGKDDAFVPAKDGDDVVVSEGRIYFHNASGARKATGSYFTKEFAVEHLLETALDPTLAEHLDRVAAMIDEEREADAAAALFDFRVADIAMGSGHFLVGAVTHIADGIEGFLAEHGERLPHITKELEELRKAAKSQLASVGLDEADVDIRTSDLILRQVAKRCIYGVDINEIAVDLARLALWIHTFVPGLPMSALDHGLVAGNSLTGIASIDELLDVLEPGTEGGSGQVSLFYDELAGAIAAADEPLARAARLAEATVGETLEAERLHHAARVAVEPVRLAMDAAIAARVGKGDGIGLAAVSGWEAVVAQGNDPEVRRLVEELKPVHFPVAFPEVFRGGLTRPGFQVVLGNPPWDEVMVEEPKFWQRYEAGVMGLKPAAQKKRIAELREERPELVPLHREEAAQAAEVRRVLLSGPYPGLGTGDVDYYQAFAWRYVGLLRDSGRLGVVFPRSLLNAAGTAEWRENALKSQNFELAVVLVNSRNWVFDDADARYSVVLLTLRNDGGGEFVNLAGPLHSRVEFDERARDVQHLSVEDLTSWGNGAAFPVLPSADALDVFKAMRQHPRFDASPLGDFRPVREFDATNDRKTFDAGGEAPGRWPVLTGASFNHWDPDFGDSYAWADSDVVSEALFEKRKRQSRNKRSAFFNLPPEVVNARRTIPCLSARIAYRDVARANDSRTSIGVLVPPECVLTNKAPYLLRRGAGAAEEAALLGIMSSIPFDWYVRCFVEISMSVHVVTALPVPKWAGGSSIWARLVELAGTLAAVDGRFAAWAEEVGVPVGGLAGEAMEDAIAEIDALVSHLYGLSREHVEIVFSTFHRGLDYKPRLAAVLDHYDAWADRAATHHSEATP